MRKQIAAANWKMNLLRDEALELHRKISEFPENQTIQILPNLSVKIVLLIQI